ncbi:hypothetical protein PFISCL1PPCAC_16009, partial [Pristionchus fissidentatus]
MRWKWPFIISVHAISFIIPVATRWPAIIDYVFNVATNSFIQDRKNTIPVMIAMICYGSIVLTICMAENIYAAFCLLKYRKTNRTSKNELSFTLISFCIFLAQTMNISIVVLNALFLYTGNLHARVFLSTITPYTSDIFSLGPAVYTLLVPGPISIRMRKIVCETLRLPINISIISRNVSGTP